jgi:hypothetical protein
LEWPEWTERLEWPERLIQAKKPERPVPTEQPEHLLLRELQKLSDLSKLSNLQKLSNLSEPLRQRARGRQARGRQAWVLQEPSLAPREATAAATTATPAMQKPLPLAPQ